tara:strand:+ start:8719 stop:11280 length:2562 start_codon:yes stop_codon:yes gene_type:complete
MSYKGEASETAQNRPPTSQLKGNIVNDESILTTELNYQLINVMSKNFLPPTVRRQASSIEKKAALQSAKQSPRSHVILRFKRLRHENIKSENKPSYETTAVCLPQQVSFVYRLPRWMGLSYTAKHAESILNSDFGQHALRAEIEYRTPLVGYTVHDSDDADFTTPQKLPYCRLYFNDLDLANKQYRKHATRDGTRRIYMTEYVKELLSDWRVPHAKVRYLERDAFSAHHLTNPKEAFFNTINSLLDLKQPHLCTFNSWFTIDINQLVPCINPFTTADTHYRAKNYNFVLKVENNDTIMPFRILSFDLEQFAPKNSKGFRPFPMPGNATDGLTNIGVAIQSELNVDDGEKVNYCFCVGNAQLTQENINICENLQIKNFSNECQMLEAFWKFLRQQDVDIVSGFNIVGFDLSCIWCRSYMYYACQTFSYHQLSKIVKVARKKMAEHKKNSKKDITFIEKAQETAKLFNIRSTDFDVMKRPPAVFYALSKASHFTYDDYQFFRTAARGIDTENFFFISNVLTTKCVYEETNFEANATGSLVQKMFLHSYWSVLDPWLYLKKSLHKLKSYSLKNCMQHFCPNEARTKVDLPYDVMFSYLESNDPIKLGEVAVYCAMDAFAPLLLIQQLQCVLETQMFSSLVRVPFSLLMTCGQQKKIISKLKERIHLDGWVLNNYPKSQDNKGKYKGAIVVPPKSGYHQACVGTLDFASLYPSIMIANNIGFSTFVWDKDYNRVKKLHLQTNKISSDLGDCQFIKKSRGFAGLVPMLSKELLQARKKVKKEMKQASGYRKSVLNKRQLSIKVLANSVYGFVGTKTGPLSLRKLAASVTAKGREMIMTTRKVCKQRGYEVIYGDTGKS